jgi:adhesin transport system outer membrane protein
MNCFFRPTGQLLWLTLLCSNPVWSQSLPQLLEAATTSHPSVRNHQAQQRAALKSVEAAKWQFFPTPSVAVEGVNASKDDPSYQGDAQVSYLRLQQPLWTGGRLTSNQDKARVNLELAQANTADTQLQLALRVVQAYADWATADLKVKAFQSSVDTHQQLLVQARNRIAEGVSPASDLNLVQGRADATAAEQSVAELQRQQALNRLVELTGQSSISQASLQAHSATAPPWPTEVASLTDQALAHHPGMRRAQLQRRLAELTVSERQSELQPDVYIRAERQWGHFAIKNAAPENRVFIGFNSKLGAGLSNFSNLEAATEQLSAAAAEVETQERLVREQVAAELAQAQSFALRHRALDGALASSNTVFQSFGRQFNAGRKSWLDLMTAARELATAEVQMAELSGAELLSAWRLQLLTQGLFSLPTPTP